MEDTIVFTREQVSAAVNNGANQVLDDDHIYVDDKTYDLINLIVNAQLTLLDNPDASLDDGIAENYDPDCDEDIPDDEPEEQRRARIIRTVRSWVS